MSSSFRDLMEEISPSWLLTADGRTLMRGLGIAKDGMAYLATEALRARFPRFAPADALAQLGDERGLPRAVSETRAAYAERLVQAWDIWSNAGTARGILTALVAAGYTNCVLVIANRRAYAMGADYVLHTRVLPEGSFKFRPVTSPYWSEYALLFPSPLPERWQTDGVPLSSSDEANFIRGILRRWKPGHMRTAEIAIATSEETWDFFEEGGTWSPSAARGHELDDDTLALYRMDEASGSMLDAAPGARHLSVTGSPVSTAGLAGGAGRLFNATGQSFQRTITADTELMSLITTGEHSFEFWMDLNGIGPLLTWNLVGVSNGPASGMTLSTTRSLRMSLGGLFIASPAAAVPLSGRTHCAGRISKPTSTTRKLDILVNGAQVATLTGTPTFGTLSQLYVGTSGSTPVGATFDDYRVSKKARTDSEFWSSYSRGIGGTWGDATDWIHWSA